jgi:hypothetical protein
MGSIAAESQAEFDIGSGVLSFCVKVSPRKKGSRRQSTDSLMKRAGREVGEEPKGVKQPRPSRKEGEETAEQSVADPVPSAREIAAAEAARARLYGDTSEGV